MASDKFPSVAVIGSGAAGLGAAWLLARAQYDVHLFEAQSRPGGHANTVEVPIPGASPPSVIPVDTGFMVYNTKTYPDLVSLFQLLSVEEDNSSMSFSSSVYLPSGQFLEWGSDSLATLFADRANLYRPAMYTMLYDMNRFNSAVHDFVHAADDPTYSHRHITLAQFLDQGAYSTIFIRAYLIPMVAAVWSASFNSALEFPARSLFHFFVNHGLAQVFTRPQWRTPAKRSRDYVNRLLNDFQAHAGTLHLSSPVSRVSRHGESVTVCVKGHQPIQFDHVIFATHPPDTLRILDTNATAEERHILSAFQYSTNKTYVHHDARLMPKNRAVWSSWNFIGRYPSAIVNCESTKIGATKSGLDSIGATKSGLDSFVSDEKEASMQESNQQPDQSRLAKSRAPSKRDFQTDIASSSSPQSISEAVSSAEGHTSKILPEPINLGAPRNIATTRSEQSDFNSHDDDPVCISYWLNRLQNYHKYHVTVPDLFITLNPTISIDREKILAEISYDHPQFTEAAVKAQAQIQSVIQGKNRIWFCGAYTRYGFHEDAIMSGLDVAEKLTNYTVQRPWRAKNCLAINDNSRHFKHPYSSMRAPLLMFFGAMLVLNAVISRLQAGLGKIAARMTDRDPVVLVSGGQGRVHRFGPQRVRRRTRSYFGFSLLGETSTETDNVSPLVARVTVRNARVLVRIADALRQGLELAPTAAAAFAAAELDCPSPTDLSEMLRALFIADSLDDPSDARRGRAKLAENLLSVIVGSFDEVRSMCVHTHLPELTNCMINVVSPSWWLELDEANDQLEDDETTPLSLFSKVSPRDLKNTSNVLELLGDLSEITVALLQKSPMCYATIVVQTVERIDFIKLKADLLFVGDQVSVLTLEEFRKQTQAGFGASIHLDKDELMFDLVLAPGVINNYRCYGFNSAEHVMELIRTVTAPKGMVEIGAVVYGKRLPEKRRAKNARWVESLFSGDDGYCIWEMTDVLHLADLDAFDLQHVAFLGEEEAAMDVYEVIQRVYDSLGKEKLKPNETRSVLAQMCLWQAALSVKYLRRMAISFTMR